MNKERIRIPEIRQHMLEVEALRWDQAPYRDGIISILRKDTAGFTCSWSYVFEPELLKPISAHRRRAGDALLCVKKEVDKALDTLCECGDELHRHTSDHGPCTAFDMDPEGTGCPCPEFKAKR